MSVWPIIERTKGRLCYTLSCVSSGTKKSLAPPQVVDGFFVPGDPRFFVRVPFCMKAVAGLLAWIRYVSLWTIPATVYLLTGFLFRSGRSNSESPFRRKQIRAGHCLYLSSFFHPERAAKSLLS